jgi:predicted 3-demethylubiquinone-9 3-methyltransferase (glyoxalase superfamily)
VEQFKAAMQYWTVQPPARNILTQDWTRRTTTPHEIWEKQPERLEDLWFVLGKRFLAANRRLKNLGSSPDASHPPGRYEQPQGFSVSLQVKDPAEAERIFHALAKDGKVQMPIQQTFWAARFGMVVDRFGIPWMINYEKTA